MSKEDAEIYIDGLVVKAQNEDIDSFSLLYDELLDPVYKFCFFRVPTKELAEDITSDVFLTVWNKLDTYSKSSGIKFKSWVFRIAQNKIIDFFRKNKDTLELKTDILIEDKVSKLAFNKVENDFLKVRLQKALNSIAYTQSQSLILKYFSQLENSEIAEIMEKSETAVRILQSRGVKNLRKQLPSFEDYL
ncbi:TPA: sigma-70 family RNA polymerase sigma factor [Candidatus Peregrinibacteria bacterium]|nr:sigma-70 family RNA polymerase sigma factor [Candidatus Peregrinibacteria bacterium]HIQ57751.1 sigma-70 family RNA polymerase sigma factor [Candidatus Gracilibacteria bacterium]